MHKINVHCYLQDHTTMGSHRHMHVGPMHVGRVWRQVDAINLLDAHSTFDLDCHK